MKYIDTKKLVNYTITKIITEIKKSYNENEILNFTKNYQCENLREIISLLICQDCNVDVDSIEFIKELESELYSVNFDLHLSEAQVDRLESSNDELKNDIEKINSTVKSSQYSSSESELIEQYNQILKVNGLDFETEIQKLTPQSNIPNIGHISR